MAINHIQNAKTQAGKKLAEAIDKAYSGDIEVRTGNPLVIQPVDNVAGKVKLRCAEFDEVAKIEAKELGFEVSGFVFKKAKAKPKKNDSAS